MSFIDAVRRLLRLVPRSVAFNEEKVVRTMSNGEVEVVRWSELQSVAVITTGDGPWSEDVFWVLRSQSGEGAAVPQGAQGAEELLKRLQALPGFRDDLFIQAMGSTQNATFVCWERSSAP